MTQSPEAGPAGGNNATDRGLKLGFRQDRSEAPIGEYLVELTKRHPRIHPDRQVVGFVVGDSLHCRGGDHHVGIDRVAEVAVGPRPIEGNRRTGLPSDGKDLGGVFDRPWCNNELRIDIDRLVTEPLEKLPGGHPQRGHAAPASKQREPSGRILPGLRTQSASKASRRRA